MMKMDMEKGNHISVAALVYRLSMGCVSGWNDGCNGV